MDEELYFSIIDEYLASEQPARSVGILVLSPDKEVLSINAAAEVLLGVTMAEALERTCDDLLRCDLLPNGCPTEIVLSEGRTITEEVVLSPPVRSEPTTVQLSLAPILASNGEKFGVVGVIHRKHRLDPRMERLEDITRESIRARAQLAAITDSTSQGIFAVDRDTRVTFLNRAGRQITGFEEDEVRGKKVCQGGVSQQPLRRGMPHGANTR